MLLVMQRIEGWFLCLFECDGYGEGMDEETLRKVVEFFFTTKGFGKGIGFGFSMVHGFVEQYGGCFILRSEKGKGMMAELWLLVVKAFMEVVALTCFAQAALVKALCLLAVWLWTTTLLFL